MCKISGPPDGGQPPDLTDTSNCPEGGRCESCGIEADDVVVCTVTTELGVMCLSLCERCATSDVPPPIHVGTAARLVVQHLAHVQGGA